MSNIKYILGLEKNEDGSYSVECNTAIIDGQKQLLHNELSCTFTVADTSIHVTNGWHIGTEDFDLTEGDDWVLEKYHPGITKQILAEIPHADLDALLVTLKFPYTTSADEELPGYYTQALGWAQVNGLTVLGPYVDLLRQLSEQEKMEATI